MAAGIQLPGNNETIDLQQQVFRLQALLEASRQVHATIREEEVLESVLIPESSEDQDDDGTQREEGER